MSTSYYIPSSSLDKSYVTKSELQDDLTDYYTKYALTSGTTNLKLGNATVVEVLTLLAVLASCTHRNVPHIQVVVEVSLARYHTSCRFRGPLFLMPFKLPGRKCNESIH